MASVRINLNIKEAILEAKTQLQRRLVVPETLRCGYMILAALHHEIGQDVRGAKVYDMLVQYGEDQAPDQFTIDGTYQFPERGSLTGFYR